MRVASVLLGVLLSMCGGYRGERAAAVLPQLQWQLETTPTQTVLRLRAGAHTEPEVHGLRTLERIHLQLFRLDGQLLEELELVPSLGGMAPRDSQAESLMLAEQALLKTAPSDIPGQLRGVCRCVTAFGEFTQEVVLQRFHRSGALVLAPSVEVSDSGVTFRLRARRVQPVAGEYFPSSERLRVELFQGGKRWWSSAEGVAFLQVIGAVEPTEVGAEVEYSLRWDGRLPTGERLPAGDYQLRLTLPARPQEYVLELPFRWGMP